MTIFSEHASGQVDAQLWNLDAGDFLSTLPDNSVDLIATSPPYFIGKEYDRSQSVIDFQIEIRRNLSEIERCLKPGASICWQVGNRVDSGVLLPLDYLIMDEMRSRDAFFLRNRMIWTFGHGTHSSKRFSGRHETVLWYTKGEEYFFDLDAVRVPQRYPGKKHYKGPKRGDWSGNPLGKNPGDVWDIGDIWGIPNVKANHIEKTEHPCQFPTALIRRLVAALSPKCGLVVDPYLGSGTTAVAALLEGRNAKGSDVERRYLEIAADRLVKLQDGSLLVREDVPVHVPSGNESVTRRPAHFAHSIEISNG